MTDYDEEKIRKKSERHHHLRRKIERYMNEYDNSDNIETTNRLKFKVELERISVLSKITFALEELNRSNKL